MYLISSSGQSLCAFLSVNALSDMARQFSGTRYSDPDYREPATFLLLSVFIYFAGYLGGVIFARSGSRLEKLAAFSRGGAGSARNVCTRRKNRPYLVRDLLDCELPGNARVYGRAAAVAQLAPRVGHIGFGSNGADGFVCDGASDAYERHLCSGSRFWSRKVKVRRYY